jgi:hypothetical protein
MPATKQVTVFLENKPGRLGKILSALAKEKVNVVALTIMDSQERSVLRLVTNDPQETVRTLDTLGVSHTQSDVLAVELRNQPGALAHLCEQLATAHINIDYAYCSSGGRNGKVFAIFKVSNMDKAVKLLGGALPSSNHRRVEARLRPRNLRAGQNGTRMG